MQVPSSQLIDPSRQDADVRLWHDQLFAKPAKHGGVVAWYGIVVTLERTWEIFGRAKKLVNLANHGLFTKIFIANIHR